MGNFVSKSGRLSVTLPYAAIRPVAVKVVPIVLAAALVGCASNAQHRGSGELSSKAQAEKAAPVSVAATKPAYSRPASYTEPANPHTASPQTTATPEVFKDDASSAGQEENPTQPELFADEGTQAESETQAPARFTDETVPAAAEKPFVQQPFADDAAPQQDDSTTDKQRFADDTAPATEDDAVAQQKFTDETPTTKDEPVARDRFNDDATTSAQEESVPPEVFRDQDAGTAPEDLVRPPETFADDEKLAEAEQAKLPDATMLPMTITVEADPLFDFDQYVIRPESRKKLDDLVQQLKGVLYGEVISVGFADPIGTHTYNQDLSRRRAAAVEQYLLSKGIPSDKVRIEARGDTEEFASYQGCREQGKQNLIACLQPDRRVEVTVTAAKQQ